MSNNSELFPSLQCSPRVPHWCRSLTYLYLTKHIFSLYSSGKSKGLSPLSWESCDCHCDLPITSWKEGTLLDCNTERWVVYLGTSKPQNLPRLQRAFLELKRPLFYGSVPGLLFFSAITLLPLFQPNFFLVFVDMRTRDFGVTLSDDNSFTQDEEQV